MRSRRSKKKLKKEIEALQRKIDLDNRQLQIVNEELTFLHDNKILSGKDQALSTTAFREGVDFYQARVKANLLAEYDLQQGLKDKQETINKLYNQLNTIKPKKVPSGEIWVKVDAKTSTTANFEISYCVKNAGWYPSYDVRSSSISEPINIIYKANVYQNTGLDWKGVKISFSSGNPDQSGVAPELMPYYLNYGVRAPMYKTTSNSVSGKILDQQNQPLPGASIVASGTSIGTVSDVDGRFTLTLPANSNQIEVSYVGFNPKTVVVTQNEMNIVLSEAEMEMEEVVAVGYGTMKKDVKRSSAPSMMKKAEMSSIAIETEVTSTPTAFSFDVAMPFTIASTGISSAIEMTSYELPVSFEYFAIPKIDKDAFLLAHLTYWESLNLLSGEANIFFEGTFTGKTVFDLSNMSDTLTISMGRDKNVLVTTQKVKELSKKQFVGSKKEETRAREISVRNQKKQPIQITILDQVPISTNDEIVVQTSNLSGASMDKTTGEVKWNFKLEPSEQKKVELRYMVSYPKSKNLIVE